MAKYLALIFGLALLGFAAWHALPEEPHQQAAEALVAGVAAIRVDGDIRDWQYVPRHTITLAQNSSLPQEEQVEPIEVEYALTADHERVYLLMLVPGVYHFDPEHPNESPALAVVWRMEQDAGAMMGAPRENLTASLGEVDTWRWELACAPGTPSGGGAVRPQGIMHGRDPQCHLHDGYAWTPTQQAFDAGPAADNALFGVWEHTARSEGIGADGTYIFELSRPLATADPHDTALTRGETVYFGFTYWNSTESSEEGILSAPLGSAERYGWLSATLP